MALNSTLERRPTAKMEHRFIMYDNGMNQT